VLPGEQLRRRKLLLRGVLPDVRAHQSGVLPGERVRGGQLLLGWVLPRLRLDESGVLPGERVRRGQRVLGGVLPRVRDARSALLRRRVHLARALLGELLHLRSERRSHAPEGSVNRKGAKVARDGEFVGRPRTRDASASEPFSAAANLVWRLTLATFAPSRFTLPSAAFQGRRGIYS
jgi:hypothetical protein